VSYQLIVRALAEDDLLEAQRWYEAQQSGLGGEFRAAIDSLFTRLVEKPHLYPLVYSGLRRAVVRRFPYLVYFSVEAEVITVVACLHSKRRPGLVRARAR
jgi:toxin ParE1/3/4